MIDANNIDFLPLSNYHPTPPDPYLPSPSIPVRRGLVWDAAFTGNTIPSTMCTCGSVPVTVTVSNTGTTGWLEHDVELGAYNDAANAFSPVRVPLDPDRFVSPGYPYTFSFTLQAPCTPGTYELQYRMIKNNGEWFGDTLTVTVTVQPCGQVQVSGATSRSVTAHDLIAGKAGGTKTSPGLAIPESDFSSLQAHGLLQYSPGGRTELEEQLPARVFSRGILTNLAWNLFPR